MPRIARRAADGGVYHILNRGNGQQRVFHKDADYQAFIALLKELQERFALELFAYCLIPNHFHLLLRAAKGDDLGRGMQWFTTTHVRRYHRHYRGSGHVWQGRYKSFGIEDDDHLLTVARYVEGNPVRAGLVETATVWNWSSHRERCGLESDIILAPFPIDLTRGLAPPGACPRDEHNYIDLTRGLAPPGACPRDEHNYIDPTRGLAPPGACPRDEHGSADCPSSWTTFVDTPLTTKELAKVQRKIERQTREGDRLPH